MTGIGATNRVIALDCRTERAIALRADLRRVVRNILGRMVVDDWEIGCRKWPNLDDVLKSSRLGYLAHFSAT